MNRLDALPALAAGLALLAGVPAAWAGTDQAQLTVTATVRSGCSISGATIAFGDYVSGQAGHLDARGRIDFASCPQATLTFELDGGGSGNVADRRMKSGANQLRYQLYRDSARNVVWGMGNEALKTQLLVPGSGNVDVWGRIPGGQVVPAGTYTDTVTITFTF